MYFILFRKLYMISLTQQLRFSGDDGKRSPIAIPSTPTSTPDSHSTQTTKTLPKSPSAFLSDPTIKAESRKALFYEDSQTRKDEFTSLPFRPKTPEEPKPTNTRKSSWGFW